MHTTLLDEDILKNIGGVENNSFVKIIDADIDEDDDMNQIQVMHHSSYYDFENLKSTLNNYKNKFSIFSTNIQSINAKFNELQIFVKRLKEANYMFSAICIQESWLSEGDDTSQIQLEDYECIPQGKSCSSKGGLIIYLHENFTHEPKLRLIQYATWEGQVIQVEKGDTLTKPIVIGNIYRPPKENLVYYDEFIKEFSTILGKYESNSYEVIFTGDYNINLLKINEKLKISEYFDMLMEHSFYPKITVPTRLTNTKGTLIDNFLCKLSEATLDTIAGVLINRFSDHQPYFILLDNINTKILPPTYVKISKQDNLSMQNFKNEIIASEEIHSLSTRPEEDPNVTYSVLHTVIQNAKDRHLPSKLVKFDKHKHKKSKWITYGIIKSIQYRDNLYKNLKTSDPLSLEYFILKTNLATYNTILKKSIRIAKSNYYHALFDKFKNDIRGTWKCINEILNKTKRKKVFPLLFKDGTNIVAGKLQIANRFNTFFTNIGSKLSNQIKPPQNKSFKNYLTRTLNQHSFKFQNINEDIVGTVIDKFAPKVSFGFDGISSKLIKMIKDALVKPITIIINQMLTTGIFPEKLKIAKVIPLYKKDDAAFFNNYRPISLLPAISKIFEKVIFKQLYQFFSEKKLLYKSQYGFRTEHSTEFAAVEVVDRILTEMDQMNTPINVFLDLSKAFDTLDHEILLEKLLYYGIKGVSLKLMESYLTNRKQYVNIDGTCSEMSTLNTGVPQGSILGPLLFIIYINDIAEASKIFNFIIYADDTTLSTTLEIVLKDNNTRTTSQVINEELMLVSNWLKLNKLSLNVQKSKYMIFHTPKKKVDSLHLTIDGTIIERVSDFNFLGLTLDENLNWKSQLNKISNNISKSIGILNKIKRIIPLKTKILIYNSLILPRLNYGILVWGYHCERVTQLQKKSVRILCLSKYNAHTEPIFKELKLLKVKDILWLQELKFYYKYKNDKLPHYLQNLPLQPNTDTHNYATRTQHNIHHPKTQHEYAKKCIRFNMPKVINSSPNEILHKITTHSLQGYSGYIKQYILNSYEVNCTIPHCYICNR